MRNLIGTILFILDIVLYYRKIFVTIVLCLIIGITIPYLLSGNFNKQQKVLGAVRAVFTMMDVPRWFK